MTTSRRELILADIETTLKTIVAGSVYNNTITNVQRWKQRGNPILIVPAIIINAGREEKESGPFPQTTCRLTVFLDLWYRQDEEATENTDTVLGSLLADIEKALASTYTRGGYAENTTIRGITPFETIEGAAHCGLMIELEVLYKHSQTDPALYI